MDILSFFASTLGDYTHQGHEYLFYCPFCHHHKKKLSINFSKRKWKCWVCDAKGSSLISLCIKLHIPKEQLVQLKSLLHDEIGINIEQDLAENVHLSLPAEFHPLWKQDRGMEYKTALKYVSERSLTAGDVFNYNIGFCASGLYGGRIIVPSYDAEGNLNFFVGRDYTGNTKLKYKNPPVSKNIIGFENHINWKYPIVLCEGVFDAMTIKQNAVPLFGKTLSNKLRQKILDENVQEIYVALDKDAREDALKIVQYLVKEGRTPYLVEMQDKDPNVIGFKEMHHLLTDTPKAGYMELLAMKLNQ